ncbi:hypothetical protein [Vibrio panuliri]|uniref:hypothetical protein n=1 Tax=Vibrio panuliri TaxID=1381081 RepID=UPI000A5F2876|nr:hypothetical protein [Vibrio panuliri]
MNNPKIFLIAFAIACSLLAGLLLLKPNESPRTVEARVVSQTLTQSLDGHRRYLNVVTQDNQALLITSPAQTDCPKGSIVLLEAETTLIQQQTNYRFQTCYPVVAHDDL